MNTETTAVAPVAKPETKMSKARELLRTITAEEIPEGSSIRKQFIARAQSEIAMSKSGAVTYYNNLQNEAKGNPLYKYPSKKPAAAAPVDPVQSSEPAGDSETEAAAE